VGREGEDESCLYSSRCWHVYRHPISPPPVLVLAFDQVHCCLALGKTLHCISYYQSISNTVEPW
jgi:hypothetical protein